MKPAQSPGLRDAVAPVKTRWPSELRYLVARPQAKTADFRFASSIVELLRRYSSKTDAEEVGLGNGPPAQDPAVAMTVLNLCVVATVSRWGRSSTMDSVDVSGGRGKWVVMFEGRGGGGGWMSTEAIVEAAGNALGKARPRAPEQPTMTAEMFVEDIVGVVVAVSLCVEGAFAFVRQGGRDSAEQKVDVTPAGSA